jgi:hypothetical protein
VTEAANRLSADIDSKEQEAGTAAGRIERLFAFLLCENSEGKGDFFCE